MDLLLPPSLKIKCFYEAIKSLEEVQNFLDSHMCFTEVSTTNSLIDCVAQLCTVDVKQSTLRDYFTLVMSQYCRIIS